MSRMQCLHNHLASGGDSTYGEFTGYVAEVVAEPFDAVVVGGGIFGVWSAIELAQKGFKVALLDAREPGHEAGSSHGDGRIFRMAYTEEIYVNMMKMALEKWIALEEVSEEKLLYFTGGVHIAKVGDEDSLILESMYLKLGLIYERLPFREACERFPQFSIEEGWDVLYQPDYGVLFATKCVKACWKHASSLCDTFENQKVIKIEKKGTSSLVYTNTGKIFLASNVIIAAGAWTSKLLKEHFEFEVPTCVTAEVVSYFAVDQENAPGHEYTNMPVFISSCDNGLNSYGYYGLPVIEVPGVKLSAHYAGFKLGDVESDRPLMLSGGLLKRIHNDWGTVGEHCSSVIDANCRLSMKLLPFTADSPFRNEICLYTSTQDHDFIISELHGGVFVVGGGSGHGFKHGPAVGVLLANLVSGEETEIDISRFSIHRHSLHHDALLKMK